MHWSGCLMAFIDTVIIINYLFIEANKNDLGLDSAFERQYQITKM